MTQRNKSTHVDAALAASLLREAADKIEQALIRLDTRNYQCASCGARHHENYVHAKVYEATTDAPAKLRERANRLENAEK